MSKQPQDTSAEEPDGGNPHIRFRGGPRQGDRPGLLNRVVMARNSGNPPPSLAPLITPTALGSNASTDIGGGMNAVLADVFALYVKTRSFHWHMSGPHFHDYHLLLDEQADTLYAMTYPIAERIRKSGGSTLRSIGHIARIQRAKDNNRVYVEPLDMLAELREDNQELAARLREVHNIVDEHGDIGTVSLIESWIGETERRIWFLFESSRNVD
jgi:starvation-inducible DNA-binding protein